MVDLSIGIVTYNSENEIEGLLRSIFEYTSGLSFHVYVVDNMSQDSTVRLIHEKFPQVTVIESKVNNGFGHGHNQVLPVLDSRYHAIVNPDILLNCDVFKYLVEYMDVHSECVICTPKVLNSDGTEQHLPKRRPTFKYLFGGRLEAYGEIFKKIRREYTMADRNLTEPTEIEFCTGCFMVMRTEIFQKCRGFDERFFMYFEDADLSDRARQYGKIIFHPHTQVIHKWERTSSKKFKFLKIHLQSYFRYVIKNITSK